MDLYVPRGEQASDIAATAPLWSQELSSSFGSCGMN